jgi:Tfp pilus assembly protein PilO
VASEERAAALLRAASLPDVWDMHVIDDEARRFGRLLHYAGVLATAITAAAGYSLIHAPTMRAVAERSARIEEVKLSLENQPVVREQHRKVTERLQEATNQIAHVRQRVPAEANSGEFLKEVTQLASAVELAINDFNPGKPQDKAGYSEIEVTLKGTGSFASICSFVERLAKLKRLSKVKNLTVSAGDDSDNYPMTATLVIYFGLQGKTPQVSDGQRRG